MDVAGTPYYIAPEVLSGNYGKECDIWSLGVCIYQLLTGEMPFDGSSQAEVFGKIKKGEFGIPPRLSDECKDLLKKMIVVDVSKRITARQALEHKWIKFDMTKAGALGEDVVKKLKEFKGDSLLKQAAMNVLVK